MHDLNLLPTALLVLALAACDSGNDCPTGICPANEIRGFIVAPDSVFVGDTVTVTAQLAWPLTYDMTTVWESGLSSPRIRGGGVNDTFVVGTAQFSPSGYTNISLSIERHGRQPSTGRSRIQIYPRPDSN